MTAVTWSPSNDLRKRPKKCQISHDPFGAQIFGITLNVKNGKKIPPQNENNEM